MDASLMKTLLIIFGTSSKLALKVKLESHPRFLALIIKEYQSSKEFFNREVNSNPTSTMDFKDLLYSQTPQHPLRWHSPSRHYILESSAARAGILSLIRPHSIWPGYTPGVVFLNRVQQLMPDSLPLWS